MKEFERKEMELNTSNSCTDNTYFTIHSITTPFPKAFQRYDNDIIIKAL